MTCVALSAPISQALRRGRT